MTRLSDLLAGGLRLLRDPNALTVSAERSLASLMQAIGRLHPDWVVVVRRHEETGERFLYAYLVEEIREMAGLQSEFWQDSLISALNLHEWGSSLRARGDRIVTEDGYNRAGPAAGRVVELDPSGDVVALAVEDDRPATGTVRWFSEGEAIPATSVPIPDDFNVILEKTFGVPSAVPMARPGNSRPPVPDADEDTVYLEEEAAPPDESPIDLDTFDYGTPLGVPTEEEATPFEFDDAGSEDDTLGLGNRRGTGGAPQTEDRAPSATVAMTFSATAPMEVEVGTDASILYLLERSETARPLAQVITARARPNQPIMIILAMHGVSLELVSTSVQSVDPPSTDQPTSGFFRVRGLALGPARLELTFTQEGAHLGSIGLEVEVIDDLAKPEVLERSVPAQPPRVEDADTLLLQISERSSGDEFRYEYFLYGRTLGIVEKFLSEPLKDAGGGRAKTEIDFVQRLYKRVTPELQNAADLRQLTSDIRRIGQLLSRELFPDAAIRRLWPLRDKIDVIQVVSFEPYVPWELVRLEHPDSQEVDDRFLAEYGLVRTASGVASAQTLALSDWCWLAAEFPMKSFPSVGSEADFFSGPDESLSHPDIRLEQLVPNVDDLLGKLSDGNFDVLHVACHAESDHEAIESARLIIGDEQGSGATPRKIGVDTVSIHAEARLKARRPLVFLNACETGREGVVLTSWGGWPKVFMERGAGAFVGASWPVYDRPAAAFARYFYRTLLSGGTLSQAARAGREAAKAFGDASWLAFKVYGDPAAFCPKPPFDPFSGQDV